MPYGCAVETDSLIQVWELCWFWECGYQNTAHGTFFHELSKLQPDLEAMGFVLLLHGSLFPRFDYFSSSCFGLLLKMMQSSMREGRGKQPTAC